MSTGDKLVETKTILTAMLAGNSLTTLVAVGRAQGLAWAGEYFARHSGSTKYQAFFLNAAERLAEIRQALSAPVA